jgi:glutamate N-acetyltransferase / amino-acid N-acetyltransferase
MAVAVERTAKATGAVTAAKGFVAGAVHAGIRKEKLDLTVLRSTVPAVGAGMFTTNRVQAAPVLVSKAHLANADPQAVVINSGVANAATGKQGTLDALATAAETARLLGIEPEQVLVLSTGVIGVKLPMPKLLAGLGEIELAPDGGADAAEAILTTDSHPKESIVSRSGFTVGGMAKGAGMIHPCLATMLAVVTTDYPLAAGEVHAFLKRAVGESFNRISVDGECSTNDAVLLLANGASGIERTPQTDREFVTALSEVCADLSRQIVMDGEGATVLLEVAVTGAASPGEAEAVAKRIATSPLVKTAAFGRDPNWGRILAAAGSAFVSGGFAQVDVDRLTLRMNGVTLFADGEPTGADVPLEGSLCRIDLDLGLGKSEATYLASDLTYDYVRINAEYTT